LKETSVVPAEPMITRVIPQLIVTRFRRGKLIESTPISATASAPITPPELTMTVVPADAWPAAPSASRTRALNAGQVSAVGESSPAVIQASSARSSSRWNSRGDCGVSAGPSGCSSRWVLSE
jgi:hypothetical protein